MFENKNTFTIVAKKGDVDGDGLSEKVYLTGTRTQDSPFVQNITLHIFQPLTETNVAIPLTSNAGYNPTLFLGPFIRPNQDDILIGIASGGSGGTMYYYIYSYRDNGFQLTFDYDKFNQSYQYQVNYKNDYKVELFSVINSEQYLIDLSLRDAEYLNEIYDEDGILKEPVEGFVNPLSGLFPVDFDGDGIYELLLYQKIAGRYNADSLGYVQTVLKWDLIQFTLWNQYVAVYGK